MSNADKALERADHQQAVQAAGRTAPQTIEELLRHPGMQKQMQIALPKGMDAERILRIAMTALRQTPKLAACSPQSFVGALFQSAQLGLEPSNGLGHAWLIPYGREVQFQIGYRGLLELARRSGEIETLYAHVVYEGDHFVYQLGLDPRLEHTPALGSEPADERIVAVYAVARFKDGGYDTEVMTRGQVDAIRKRSKASGSGPWVTDYAEMARKTVLKRLCKRLPLAVEVQRAIAQDETVKTHIDVDMTAVPDESESPDVFAGQAAEVIDGETVDDAPSYADQPANEAVQIDATDAVADEPNELDLALGNVTPLHDGAAPATAAQMADIKRLRKGLNAAEFNSLAAEYGEPGADNYGLTVETAGYLIEALRERS